MSGKGAQAQANQAPAVSGLSIQTSVLGKPRPLVYGTTRVSPNLIDYDDFAQIPHFSPQGGGGKGGGGGGGKGGGAGVTYTYSVTIDFGLAEGPCGFIGTVWQSKNVTNLAALGLSFFPGTYPQSPWSFMSTNHAAKAIGYNGLAHVAGAGYDLGNSAQLPQHTFELHAVLSTSIAGQIDADPSQVVPDFLTNPDYGLGFPAARVGSLTNYQDYVIASGLWISPQYTTQTQASQILDDIARYTNSEFVWSSGLLTLVPRGDQAITANGHTYTPPGAAQFDLGDDDFMPQSGGSAGGSSASDDPVLLTRKRPADVLNNIQLEFLNRANSYNPEIVEASDQSLIDLFGKRSTGSQDAHIFCDAAAARLSAQLMLQRNVLRNLYTFTLDQRYVVLDPMDIVTLTDATLGLSRAPVRILEITEDDNGNLQFVAEDYLGGVGSAAAYSFGQGAAPAIANNQSPGSVNPPIIFMPPTNPTFNQTGLEVWMGVSGASPSLYGGCDVWLSTDGTTYKFAGRMIGASRMGALTATLASHADPDTVDTCAVDLTESAGQLLSATALDCDLNHALCYVGGELISYQTATLTGTNKYNLTTRLRRGVYGTPIAAHAAGTGFLRIDSNIFRLPVTKEQLNTLFHVKFLAYNIYGGGEQSLAAATDFTFTPAGTPTLTAPSGFTATGALRSVLLSWTNPPQASLAGIQIYRATSSSFGAATLIATLSGAAIAGNNPAWTDNGLSPNTQYWYWIVGLDIAGNQGAFQPSSGGAGLTVTTAQAGTPDLVANAVSINSNSIGGGATLTDDATYHTLSTISFTLDFAANVSIIATMQVQAGGTGVSTPTSGFWRVLVDGASITGDIPLPTVVGDWSSIAYSSIRSLAAGGHTATLQGQNNDPVQGGALYSVISPSVLALSLKR